MADPIQLVQGDTGPDIQVTLTRQDTGEAQDLTGATVLMHFRRANRDSALFTVQGQSTAEEQVNGIAVFAFSGDQLNQVPGEYQAEFEVTFASGDRETVFEGIDFVIRKDYA